MNRLWLPILILVSSIALLAGCGGGGGGGGGGATLVGRVLNVATGGPLNPPGTVQAANKAGQTSIADGSFSLGVPNGTNSLLVLPNVTGFPTFTFGFPPATGTTVLGDLWVGPEKVTLKGRVLNSTNSNPVPGATISFAGQMGITDGSGNFSLPGVAYSSQTQTAFWGIVGTVRATNFFKSDFTAAPNVADVNNEVNVGDILITPSNDPNPPGTPFNITGRVLPLGISTGAIVRLKQNGTDVRVFNVSADGKYYFWIAPGTYTVTYEKGAMTSPSQDVVLTQPNQVVTVPDVTLN